MDIPVPKTLISAKLCLQFVERVSEWRKSREVFSVKVDFRHIHPS